MRQTVSRYKKGDTLIEVMLSISIFAMVAIIAINMMNNGINTVQRTLETEMARNEIDAQADAIRYIHNNYVAERNMDDSQFKAAWQKLIEYALPSSGLADTGSGSNTVYFDINNMSSCEEAYGANKHLNNYHAFIVNPRLMIPNNFSNNDTSHSENQNNNFRYLGKNYMQLLNEEMLIKYEGGNISKFSAPSLYPRIIYDALNDTNTANNRDDRSLFDQGIIYNKLARAEGIWVTVAGDNNSKPSRSNYYDFYIRTCWLSAGTRVPSTITTVVRLYNPEVME